MYISKRFPVKLQKNIRQSSLVLHISFKKGPGNLFFVPKQCVWINCRSNLFGSICGRAIEAYETLNYLLVSKTTVIYWTVALLLGNNFLTYIVHLLNTKIITTFNSRK